MSNVLWDIGSNFIPIYGTYKDYLAYKENPTWENAAQVGLSGIGDVLTLTGVGYGLGTMLKGAKTIRNINRGVKSLNKYRRARVATRNTAFNNMFEYGSKGKNAFKSWALSGNNIRNIDKKINDYKKVRRIAGMQVALGTLSHIPLGSDIYQSGQQLNEL